MKARAENRSDLSVSPESGVQQRRRHQSGFHPRSATPRAAALAALLDEAHSAIAATTTSPRATFDALVDVVGRALPLRAMTLVRCIPEDEPARAFVWCAQPGDEPTAEAEAFAMASLAELGGVDHRHAWSPLGGGPMGKLGWLGVPLGGEDGRVIGVLGVASEAHGSDAATSSFVVEIARCLSAYLAVEDPPAAKLSGAALVAEIETTLLDGLAYETSLAQVARTLATRVGSACVVDVLGTSPSRVVHSRSLPEPALLDAIEPLLDRVVAEGTPLSIAHPLVTLAAQELGAAWIVVLPLTTRDEVVGALALLGTADQPLSLSPAQLEGIARIAAGAIANGQTYETALAALRTRDEILSTVSHDLKNPLSVILLSAARLLEDGPDARIIGGRPAADVIHRSAMRMRRLVSDLLDAAALDGGALTMRPSRQDATRIIADTLDSLAPVAAEAGVTLHDDVPRSLPPIFVDPDRIAQVLSNLVGNAIKFTPEGGSVRIGAGTCGDRLEISVSDTGIGIAKTELPHVFDRFWRAKGTRKLGTGLGLAIAKSIVELSGGTIDAKSEPGLGTVMSFTVPLAPRLQLV